jgi:hypothetical protein
MEPRLLSSLDVAELLAITPRQATRLINRGALPTVRINKSELRVPADALQRWISENTTDGSKGDKPK